MHKWLFWVIVFGAMVLGSAGIVATSISVFNGNEITRNLIRGFGEALLIAGFIAATVDQYVKRRLLWETSHDISKYLIGFNLPPEIQDQINELMGTAIIRRDFEQHYTLSPHSESKLQLNVEARYKVLNCSNTVRDYIPHLDFEKHEVPTILEFRCDSADKKAVDRKTGNQELMEIQDGVLSIALKKVRVQPSKKGILYHVSCNYSRLVDTADSDILSFAAPTIGLTITAKCPEGFSFVAGSATVETENRWEFQRLFLNSQHLHVRWFETDKGR